MKNTPAQSELALPSRPCKPSHSALALVWGAVPLPISDLVGSFKALRVRVTLEG